MSLLEVHFTFQWVCTCRIFHQPFVQESLGRDFTSIRDNEAWPYEELCQGDGTCIVWQETRPLQIFFVVYPTD